MTTSWSLWVPRTSPSWQSKILISYSLITSHILLCPLSLMVNYSSVLKLPLGELQKSNNSDFLLYCLLTPPQVLKDHCIHPAPSSLSLSLNVAVLGTHTPTASHAVSSPWCCLHWRRCFKWVTSIWTVRQSDCDHISKLGPFTPADKYKADIWISMCLVPTFVFITWFKLRRGREGCYFLDLKILTTSFQSLWEFQSVTTPLSLSTKLTVNYFKSFSFSITLGCLVTILP